MYGKTPASASTSYSYYIRAVFAQCCQYEYKTKYYGTGGDSRMAATRPKRPTGRRRRARIADGTSHNGVKCGRGPKATHVLSERQRRHTFLSRLLGLASEMPLFFLLSMGGGPQPRCTAGVIVMPAESAGAQYNLLTGKCSISGIGTAASKPFERLKSQVALTARPSLLSTARMWASSYTCAVQVMS